MWPPQSSHSSAHVSVVRTDFVSSRTLCSLSLFLREELTSCCPDEHELCHMGSPDDECAASVQVFYHNELICASIV